MAPTEVTQVLSNEENDIMRSKAYSLCRDYLLGAWKLINEDTMVIRRISGGLSNHLYYCALPHTQKPVATEPKEVLLRLYGRMHGEDALENMLAESVIFTLLSERGLGPYLYGVFPGGRLEEFIPARSLYREELEDQELSTQIATKLAKVHSLNVPISKEASWLWTSINKWLISFEEILSNSNQDEVLVSKIKLFDGRSEVRYLKSLVDQLDCPVVFAHNDLQEGNILLLENQSAREVALIDFEYCAYNYRSFDFANHFSERVYGYKLETAPYFTVHKEEYPSVEDQLIFIRKYLEEYRLSARSDQSSRETGRAKCPMSPRLKVWFDEAKTPEEKILKEIKIFNLAGHLFWLLWSTVQGHVSTINFGYLEYAKTRMEHYHEEKFELEREIEAASLKAFM